MQGIKQSAHAPQLGAINPASLGNPMGTEAKCWMYWDREELMCLLKKVHPGSAPGKAPESPELSSSLLLRSLCLINLSHSIKNTREAGNGGHPLAAGAEPASTQVVRLLSTHLDVASWPSLRFPLFFF